MNRRLRRVFRLVAALLAAPCVAAAAPETVDPGQAIFADGQGAGSACANCHGRDGRGGGEADAPPIDGPALAAATKLRPAYDRRGLAQVLRDGITPDGRSLGRLMPRYDLDDADIAGLWTYLQGLPARQRRGVTADAIRIGVAGEGYAAAVQAALPGGRIHGRTVDLVPLADDMPALPDPPVLAVMGPRSADTPLARAALRAGVPVLFPLAPLAGDESPSIIRSFLPSRQATTRFLLRQVADARPSAVVILVGEGGDAAQAEDLARDLRVALAAGQVPVTVGGGGPASDALLLGGARRLPGGVRRVWTLGLPDPAITDTLGGAALHVILPAPMIVETARATQRPALQIHAGFAAILLDAALKQAGRDVTRRGLLDALGQMAPPISGLDHLRLPLTGTDRPAMIVIPAPGG